MKAVETNTLKVFTEGFTQEDMKQRDKLLLAMHILSAIQMVAVKDLENLLNKQGIYRHEIKHTHKQIDNLVKKNYRNIFGDKYDEFTEQWSIACERVEEIIWDSIKKEFKIE